MNMGGLLVTYEPETLSGMCGDGAQRISPGLMELCEVCVRA